MADDRLIDRLAALSQLRGVPRDELAWLVAHGQFARHETGAVIGPKEKRLDRLWVILSGRIAIRVDRGVGPRMVAEWGPGDVSGRLPYSRMTAPPGDNYVAETVECIEIHERDYPELIRRCPVFTEHTVHVLVDRARTFNASDLQDEKMVSLGRLAAGLAHELNNPASAALRGARLLQAGLVEADVASRDLGAAGLSPSQLEAIEHVRSECVSNIGQLNLAPVEHADRQDDLADWLTRHGADADSAELLADTAVTVEQLDALAKVLPADALERAVRWLATHCALHALSVDVEQAANRIHELVAAVRTFTWMGNLAGPVCVDVEAGLRDTLRIAAAKARAKNATITLDIAPGLPRVLANGSELNQIWLNLIDNALDAIGESGRIDIDARREVDHVVVRVTDDGPGIPEDVLPLIFDPFFTTKPPGQGTGLGLDITRRLVNRHDGDISVESRPGRTRFRVSLIAEKEAGGDAQDDATAPRGRARPSPPSRQ